MDRGRIGGKSGQGRMCGDAIEATSGADQFAGQFHAGEHLAPGLRVVAGGGQDVRDALRARVLMQEAEDGLF